MQMKQEHSKLYESAEEAAACLPVVEPILRDRCARDLRTRCDDKRLDFDTGALAFEAAAVAGNSVIVSATITLPE